MENEIPHLRARNDTRMVAWHSALRSRGVTARCGVKNSKSLKSLKFCEVGIAKLFTLTTSPCRSGAMKWDRCATVSHFGRLAVLAATDDSQRVIHNVERAIERGVSDDQRRLDADHVSSLPSDPDQHARLARQAADHGRFAGGRLLRRPVSD